MKHPGYFNDFLRDRVNLSQSRIGALKDRVSDATSYLKDNLDSCAGFEAQGSWVTGTMVKPMGGKGLDVDLLVVMHDDDFDPYRFDRNYVEELLACMTENPNYKDRLSQSRFCVMLEYEGDFHMDVVPCVEHKAEHYICDSVDECYKQTDSPRYVAWFLGKNADSGGNSLQYTTRLFKYLRDKRGAFGASLTNVNSIVLETLLGESIAGAYDDIAHAFKELFESLELRLQQGKHVPNPVLPSEDLAEKWKESQFNEFKDKVGLCRKKVCAAYAEGDHNESVRKWREVLGDDFGALQPEEPAARFAAGSVLVPGAEATARRA